MSVVINRIVSDIGTGAILYADFDPEYIGSYVRLKKGSDEAKAATQGALDTAKTDQARQASAYNAADPFAKSLLSTTPGELSPYAKSQYAEDSRNIDKTYGDLQSVGMRQLAQRGMGNGPTGALSSLINTGNNQAGAAKTSAYNNAQQNTLNQGLQGIGYYGGLQSAYNPTGAYGTAGQNAQIYNNLASKTGLGGVISGIGSLAGAAGSVMTGLGGIGFGK